ncbi:hypothetical protein A3J61_01295 [Candidatus Nomurabacteria bacterium RIFCSPHIGHO2_02_FULL_38_15]|uniref:DUF4367 domain-containing protein n=1 Tax=Candidatus Nomurabacteria bacterium RIFCSPHIGHO2_02_FULL_38_15 TaxID=1801752 RepID=A0A1F6VSK4_9BACT|nr:MAG: hypothetical protein A3J61_01295 [Candidatus Nomurabacteria bacterium RIFCSPHIGHO2_02_FULL_38_15]
MPEEKDDILISQGAQKASIRTVDQDVSRALSGASAQIVREALDLDREKTVFKKEGSLASNKNKLWLALTLIALITITGLAIWTIQKKDKSITVEPVIIYSGLVTYDQTKTIGNFEPKSSILKKQIVDAKSEAPAIGLTRFRFVNIDPVGTNDLLKAFDWKLSPKFSSGLETTFDFGVYTDTEQKQAPFILFKTIGTDQSFLGFSLWEDNILFDLGEIFNVNAQTALDPIYQKKFVNITIESHDGRILYDADNNPLMIMIFVDENHALVTNSKEAVKEILKRVILKK